MFYEHSSVELTILQSADFHHPNELIAIAGLTHIED